MVDFLFINYLWLKAFHLISIIAWMAGMLYLPRLFVYHVEAKSGSELSETLKVMERRLLKYIMNPAMISTFIFGILMIIANSEIMRQGWMHPKILLVLCMAGCHGFLGAMRKKFERDENTKSQKFYRIINEVPTLLMIVIIILAVVKPF